MKFVQLSFFNFWERYFGLLLQLFITWTPCFFLGLLGGIGLKWVWCQSFTCSISCPVVVVILREQVFWEKFDKHQTFEWTHHWRHWWFQILYHHCIFLFQYSYSLFSPSTSGKSPTTSGNSRVSWGLRSLFSNALTFCQWSWNMMKNLLKMKLSRLESFKILNLIFFRPKPTTQNPHTQPTHTTHMDWRFPPPRFCWKNSSGTSMRKRMRFKSAWMGFLGRQPKVEVF